ncbi:MAG: FitA-like ribbon-helix-helix domain-containing protein [Desulfohalobiaceae bacterium]
MIALHTLSHIENLNVSRRIVMASLTIRNIEESLKNSLRIRAAEHGRSMEEEARQILMHSLLSARSTQGIGSRISGRFAAVGGIDLPKPFRSIPRELDFSEDISDGDK